MGAGIEGSCGRHVLQVQVTEVEGLVVVVGGVVVVVVEGDGDAVVLR